MSKETINKLIGRIGGLSTFVFAILTIYTVWDFNFFLLKVDLSLLWLIVVLYFMNEFTK